MDISYAQLKQLLKKSWKNPGLVVIQTQTLVVVLYQLSYQSNWELVMSVQSMPIDGE